jgi:hypothetical protein
MYEISHPSKLLTATHSAFADNQQSHLPSRSNPGRPISDYLAGVDFPPTRTQRHTVAPPGDLAVRSSPHPRETRRQIRPRTMYHDEILTPTVDVSHPRPGARASVVAQYLAEARRRDSSTLTLPPIHAGPSSELYEQQALLNPAESSWTAASRPHSPSRMRRLGLDPSVHSFVPLRRPAPPSPPSAASHAWLNDYNPGGGGGDDAQQAAEDADLLGRIWAAPDLDRPIRAPAPYIPMYSHNAPLNRRRRRENDLVDEEEEEERQHARHTQYVARHWEMAERTAARNEEARAMRTNEAEMEAMFGPLDVGSDSDDSSTYPRLFEPVTDRPMPIPAFYGRIPPPEEQAARNRAMQALAMRNRDTRRDGLVLDGFAEPGSAAASLEQQIAAHEATMTDLEADLLDRPPSIGDPEYEGLEGVDWRL